VVGPGVIDLTEVPEPSDPALVKVRVQQVGICGTDIKILAGDIPVEYPRTVGHEMIGEVVSAPVGAPYEPGSRVLVDPGVSCGWCDLCQASKPHLCRNGGLLGRDVDGAFTEFITVPVGRLIPVPDTISARASGLLQVLGTCVHAVKMVNPFPGRVVAVIGLGVAGQLITQLLTLKGTRVVGITRSAWKRDLAAENGAAAVAQPGDAAPVLDEMTHGRGPSVVVEAVGKEETLSSAIELVGIGGEVLVFGTITGGGQGLPYYQLYHKELTLHNPRAALPGDYADGVALTATGAVHLESIVTHELSLEQAEKAFELVNDPSSLKVIMKVA
jgi:2-desacetyl-2-hydroxyethyl bacteriochlorophyllide A dehydrogenase